MIKTSALLITSAAAATKNYYYSGNVPASTAASGTVAFKIEYNPGTNY